MPPAHRGSTGAPMDRWTTASPTAIASGFHAAMALGPQPKLSDSSTLYNNGSASGIASGGIEFLSQDDDDDDDEDDVGSPVNGSGKKKGKGKAAKKGGPRGKDPAALQHRKEQNRAAQREFRQRKQQYIRALEARVELLSSDHDTQVDRLRFALRMLLQENNSLRNILGSLASFIGNKAIGGCLAETGFSRQELQDAVDNRSEKTMTEAWQNWPGAKECEALQQIRRESNIPLDGLPESKLPFGAASLRCPGDTPSASSVEERGKKRTASQDTTGKKKKANGVTAESPLNATATPPNAMPPPSTASPDQNRIANEIWQLQQQLLLLQQQQQRTAPEANFFQNLFGDSLSSSTSNMFGSFNGSITTGLTFGSPMTNFGIQASPPIKPPTPSEDPFVYDFAKLKQRGLQIVAKVNRFIAKKGGTSFVTFHPTEKLTEQDKRMIDEDERSQPYLMLAHHPIEGAHEEDWDLTEDNGHMERLMEAFIQSSYHLNNSRLNQAYRLPPLLKPSKFQKETPHDPFIDGFTSSGIRDGLIRNPQLDPEQVAFEMLRWTQLHGGDTQLETQWELHQPFMVRFPMLIDERLLKIANHWRKSRGQKPLTMQQLWMDHETFKANERQIWKKHFGEPFPLVQ